jgi:hypothetical protein
MRLGVQPVSNIIRGGRQTKLKKYLSAKRLARLQQSFRRPRTPEINSRHAVRPSAALPRGLHHIGASTRRSFGAVSLNYNLEMLLTPAHQFLLWPQLSLGGRV